MDEIGYLLKRAQHALRLKIDKSLGKLNITLPQYVALAHISQAAGISNAELARRAFVTPQTMHRIVRGLAERELIKQASHPILERVQQLFLTEDGKRLLSQARRRVASSEAQSLTHFSDDEVQNFRTLLQKYLVGVEEKGAKANPW